MPIIVDPQKLSMPEQVQRNKYDIKEIFKKIDGLDSLDNVVEVPNMSHILTAQELKAIEQPVAFIIYNNKVYLKRKIESGIAYFDRVFAISGSTVITFESEEIQATLSNGALAMISNSVSTYSKSEIDSTFSTVVYVDNQLAQKANLTGANFTGAITASEITENMSGYSGSITAKANLVNTPIYAGVVKNGNKITIVYFSSLTRTGTISDFILLFNFNIPATVGSRLYPFTISGTSKYLDFKSVGLIKKSNGTILPVNLGIYKSSDTQINVFGQSGSLDSMEANEEYYIRYEATFLLSDSVAP